MFSHLSPETKQPSEWSHRITYDSVRGVIFFSGSSSSAKFFLYFSQFSPVALGMVRGSGYGGDKTVEGVSTFKGTGRKRSRAGGIREVSVKG